MAANCVFPPSQSSANIFQIGHQLTDPACFSNTHHVGFFFTFKSMCRECQMNGFTKVYDKLYTGLWQALHRSMTSSLFIFKLFFEESITKSKKKKKNWTEIGKICRPIPRTDIFHFVFTDLKKKWKMINFAASRQETGFVRLKPIFQKPNPENSLKGIIQFIPRFFISSLFPTPQNLPNILKSKLFGGKVCVVMFVDSKAALSLN